MGKQEAQQDAIFNAALECVCGPFLSPDFLAPCNGSHLCAVGPQEAVFLLVSETDAAGLPDCF